MNDALLKKVKLAEMQNALKAAKGGRIDKHGYNEMQPTDLESRFFVSKNWARTMIIRYSPSKRLYFWHEADWYTTLTEAQIQRWAKTFDAKQVDRDGTTEGDRRYLEENRLPPEFSRAWGESVADHNPAVAAKDTIKIGRWQVPADLLNEYADDIVKRLRADLRMRSRIGLMQSNTLKDPVEMMRLEIRRKDQHEKILKAIGLKRDNKDKAYRDFSDALELYLNERAGGAF